MDNRWQEVAELLNNYLPNPTKVEWAGAIAQFMSAEYE